MKWTPQMVIAGVLLLLVTLGALCWLPRPEAWALLGQIASSAAGVLG